jgi:hypothetical protein
VELLHGTPGSARVRRELAIRRAVA